MASPRLSCSRRGWHQKQKLCVVLLLLSNLLHSVHGQGNSSRKKLNPEKVKNTQKNKDPFLKNKTKLNGNTKNKEGSVEQVKTPFLKDKAKRNGNTKNMEGTVKEMKKNAVKKNKKNWTEEKKNKFKARFKDETYNNVKRDTQEFKKSDKKVTAEEEQELEEEMTFIDFEYDLNCSNTNTEDMLTIIGDSIQSTYNEKEDDLVMLKTRISEQTISTEEGANRYLTVRRYSSLRMRLRAAGPNALARNRPLFRSQVNRLLLPSGVRGMVGKTVNQDEASLFIEALNAKLLDASESTGSMFQPIHCDIPTLVYAHESHKNPTETLFPFETSLTYNNVNVDEEVPLELQKAAMDNFKQAYNRAFDTSLVVDVKTMSQQLIPNEMDDTTDMVFTFTGTCYTDDEVAAEERFAQIDSMAAQEKTSGMEVASEAHFFNMFDNMDMEPNQNGNY